MNLNFLKGAVRGVGQVLLADNLVAGLLIIAGISVCSRIGALAAVVGSLIAGATAWATGVSGNALYAGLYGFNASMTVTAMLMLYAPTMGCHGDGIVWGYLYCCHTTSLGDTPCPFGLSFMTLPCCAVALPFIILQGTTS